MVAVITFYDEYGKTSNVVIEDDGITSLADVEQLQLVLRPWSNCGVKSYGLVQSVFPDPAYPPTDGPYNSVEEKIRLTFRDVNATVARKAKVTMHVPGPVAGALEKVDYIGYRMSKAVGDAIAAGLNGVLTKELEFKSGKPYGHPSFKKVG